MTHLCVFLLRVSVSFLQEKDNTWTAEEEQVLPAAQQLTFDLGSLRTSFKRRREDAGPMHVDTPGSKKGRFEAASLQVSQACAGYQCHHKCVSATVWKQKVGQLQICGDCV